MVEFYKHHIADWMDGTEELSDGAYRVYHVVCQLIYLNEGPITLNERGIAGRCRQSVRAFRRNLEELIVAGKLRIEGGLVHNVRAEKELQSIEANRERARGGGLKSGAVRRSRSTVLPQFSSPEIRENSSKIRETPVYLEIRSPKPNCSPDKPLKNNDADEAPLRKLRGELRTEKSREEKTNSSAAKSEYVAARAREASKYDFDKIEERCRQAAGLEDDPSPGLLNLAPIIGLLDAGHDLEHDIAPAIRAIAKAGRKGRSWSYYVKAIIDAKTQRSNAATNGAHAEKNEPDEVRWYRMFEAWQRGTWPESWGPDPESAGCQIPRELIEQWSRPT